MPDKVFTLDDLKRILIAGAGADEAVDLDGDILQQRFDALGYESLALLETLSRIENEFDIALDDGVLTEESTPAQLIDAVNAVLEAARLAV
ncbi:phosphopantetheine-binding protein [Streptomyces phytophilus]|uniref:phosphopantetheine-binding protein n=1 Tax=Streptomyces phytophilus TaxID=722715 RepID=UPI0015F05F4C|nr:phosphopantetheine-binding protein [Streptomyces phytophilus]